MIFKQKSFHHCPVSFLLLTAPYPLDGWSLTSNFTERKKSIPLDSAKREVARNHSRRYMNNNIQDYSQWFPWKMNIIADSLTRHFTFLTLIELPVFLALFPTRFQTISIFFTAAKNPIMALSLDSASSCESLTKGSSSTEQTWERSWWTTQFLLSIVLPHDPFLESLRPHLPNNTKFW